MTAREIGVQVAVCGPAAASDAEVSVAGEVGRLLGERGATVLCGGGGGVMSAAARGARGAGGVAVAIRPDGERTGDFTAVIATEMGQARNALIVASAHAVVVVGGSWGTLSEVALAMRRGVPVVSLGGWQVRDAEGHLVPGIHAAATAEEAVAAALG